MFSRKGVVAGLGYTTLVAVFGPDTTNNILTVNAQTTKDAFEKFNPVTTFQSIPSRDGKFGLAGRYATVMQPGGPPIKETKEGTPEEGQGDDLEGEKEERSFDLTKLFGSDEEEDQEGENVSDEAVTVFEWKLYNGNAISSGSVIFFYAQFEDPENAGKFESVTCQIGYDRKLDFADVTSNVLIKNYYGSQLFRKGEAGVEGIQVGKLNLADRSRVKIWQADKGNDTNNYRMYYNARKVKSGQVCVVGRKKFNKHNFELKADRVYRGVTGYKIYKDSLALEPL